MERLMRIQGKANRVFDTIKNICQRHPYMTLGEAAKNGLLGPRLQPTVPYKPGEFPEVILDSGIENN